MEQRTLNYATTFLITIVLLHSSISAQITLDFDELNPPDQGDGKSYFDGYGAGAKPGEWSSRGAVFNTNQFGPGWSYSSVDDTETRGFLNQWAAITGSDVSGNGNYAMANSFSPDGAFFNLPDSLAIDSLMIANSTYSYWSMTEGDGFGKKFGGTLGDDPDWFKVSFTGYSGTDKQGDTLGVVDHYLADFRFDDNSLDFIVDDWEFVDLSSLGDAKSISLAFGGSDVGGFGLNTPAYAAFDNFSFHAVPEPSSLILLCSASVAAVIVRRRRRQSKE